MMLFAYSVAAVNYQKDYPRFHHRLGFVHADTREGAEVLVKEVMGRTYPADKGWDDQNYVFAAPGDAPIGGVTDTKPVELEK